MDTLQAVLFFFKVVLKSCFEGFAVAFVNIVFLLGLIALFFLMCQLYDLIKENKTHPIKKLVKNLKNHVIKNL